jgi:transcriptional regulator GlxA family with amidase domain
MPQTGKKTARRDDRLHVSLVAMPEAMLSTLSGLFDVLNAFPLLGTFNDAVPETPPFQVEIVGPKPALMQTASGLPVTTHRALAKVRRTDIVIVPSALVPDGNWVTGRHPELVNWLRTMHAGGAQLCSACSGVLLLAETGLLDGLEATIHWAYAPTFRRNFPQVTLRLPEVLIVAGQRHEFIMSGASASWHDLVLYLIARHVGPTAAQAIAKFMLLQRHVDGQAPYVTFDPPTDHGDAVVFGIQEWLQDHYSVASPVEEMVRRSGLSARSFKRRFTKATGLAPIAYVQQMRVEEAKRRLERTDLPIDEISWAVGYEDAAFFRRVFQRTTRMTAGNYRRKFRMPGLTTSLTDS